MGCGQILIQHVNVRENNSLNPLIRSIYVYTYVRTDRRTDGIESSRGMHICGTIKRLHGVHSLGDFPIK